MLPFSVDIKVAFDKHDSLLLQKKKKVKSGSKLIARESFVMSMAPLMTVRLKFEC
jgi:hypothetical protein